MIQNKQLLAVFNLWLTLVLSGMGAFAQQAAPFSGDVTKNVMLNYQGDTTWLRFTEKIAKVMAEGKGNVNIVHLGDSHIQGGYFSNRFRELLAEKYGAAGRGFVFPYVMVKTNSPEDVKFSSGSAWFGQKYNHNPLKVKTGIAGYNLSSADTVSSLSLSLKQGSDSLYPFNELVIYHNDHHLKIVSGTESKSNFQVLDTNLFASHLIFEKESRENILLFRSEGFQLYGLELRNMHPGFRYHAIGINGLSYGAYVRYIDYLPLVKALQPDCIVISLGTNDAYVRKLNEGEPGVWIKLLINSFRKEFPGCCIILTTPGDHLMDRRYVNPNLIKVQSVIATIAKEENCLYWDFFSVMGGPGASKTWLKNGLMYKDILHLSKAGYKLQAELFFEAFDNAIQRTMAHDMEKH